MTTCKLSEEEIADIEAAAYTAFDEGQRGPSDETLAKLRQPCTSTCKHGKTIGWKGPDVVWAGGWSMCVCCQQGFGWIGSASYDADGLASAREPDKEHCQGCGGRDTVFQRRDLEQYEHPERERLFYRVKRLTTDEMFTLLRVAVAADLVGLTTLRKLVERIPPDAPQRREAVLLVKARDQGVKT